jgi:hypothetical protein
MRTEEQQNLLDEYIKGLEYVKTLTKQERTIFCSGMRLAYTLNDLQNSLTLEQNYNWSVSIGLQDDPCIKKLGEYLKKKEELKARKWYKFYWN